VKPTICSLALTFLVWGSQLIVTAPDGWLPRATLTGEPATPVAVAEVVVDDCVELDPHAATHVATAAAVMNRVDIDFWVLVFKILLPRSGWRLRAYDGAKEGAATVGISRIRVADPRVCDTSRVKQYQLRVVDRSLHIPPCHRQPSPEGFSGLTWPGAVVDLASTADEI
jgi:hypothetical protein